MHIVGADCHGKRGSELSVEAREGGIIEEIGFLIGIANSDPADLARSATVTASSELPGSPATNIRSGFTRSVHGKGGAPLDRIVPGTHRWMSDPTKGLPAWVQLEWAKPIAFSEIRITFNTGLHRELTLSMSEKATANMCWGKPQPETVRDYRIEVSDETGLWHPVVEGTGNYRRLVIHRLSSPVTTQRLRVVVEKTNGAEEARILEVRVENSSPYEICTN